MGVPRGGRVEYLPGNKERCRKQNGTQRSPDWGMSKLLEPEHHHLTSAETFHLLANFYHSRLYFLVPLCFKFPHYSKHSFDSGTAMGPWPLGKRARLSPTWHESVEEGRGGDWSLGQCDPILKGSSSPTQKSNSDPQDSRKGKHIPIPQAAVPP